MAIRSKFGAVARPSRKPTKPAQPRRAPKSEPLAPESEAPAPRGRGQRIVAFTGRAALVCFVATLGVALLYRFVAPPATPLMLLRYFASGAAHHKLDYRWRPLGDISPELALAVVAAEDQLFPDHFGFDARQIIKVLQSQDSDAPLRGASTISQQSAKNVFLWPSRTWLRKGFEAYFTTLIELFWGKRRILEVYLNVAEWGPGVYGAEAASQKWFHKRARDLTRAEAATLAVMLPNPLHRSPGALGAEEAERRAWVLGQMANLGGTAYLKSITSPRGDKTGEK